MSLIKELVDWLSKKDSAQDIHGAKNFVDNPSVPNPILPEHAVPRDYVDNSLEVLAKMQATALSF